MSPNGASDAASPRDKKMINIRLSEALWKRAKASAGERGLTLERWVTDALEAHIHRSVSGARAGGAPPGTVADQESDLAWRVAALEAAVDYLASAIGMGFPDGVPDAAQARPPAQPTPPAAERGPEG